MAHNSYCNKIQNTSGKFRACTLTDTSCFFIVVTIGNREISNACCVVDLIKMKWFAKFQLITDW